MEKDQFIKLKDSYLKESKRPDGSKSTLAESVSCVMDNGLVIATAKDCVVFDDDNQLAHAIYINNDMKTQATYPISVMSVSYGTISEVESIMSKENFEKLLNEGFLSFISANKKEFLLGWADHIHNQAQQPIDVEPAYPENPEIHDNYNRKITRSSIFESTAKIMGGGQDPVFYPTLADAIINLKDGQTIKLTSDATIDKPIIMSSKINATIDLNGNTLTSKLATLFKVTDGEITITNGNIEAEGEVFRVFGKTEGATPVVNIGKDVKIKTSDSACFICGNATFNCSGKIEADGEYAPIMGNGLHENDGTVINLDGADIYYNYPGTENVAIYHPQIGTLNIKDTKITGPSVLYLKGGTTNIYSGGFYALGEAAPYKYDGNGCSGTGDCVTLDTCYDRELDINISGGKFSCLPGCLSLSYYNKQGELNPEGYKDHVNITGGVFKNKEKMEAYITDEYTMSEVIDGYVVHKK